MQRLLFLIFLQIVTLDLHAQSDENSTANIRKGLTIGIGVGLGKLKLVEDNKTTRSTTITLPNLRIGYFVNENIALQLLLPSAPYRSENTTRSFEGIMLSCQYWIRTHWWIQNGIGVTMDAPAFWTVHDLEIVQFNFGIPSFSFATGYELWTKRNFAIDIQYRVHFGKANSGESDILKGMSNMIILGFSFH